jgi:hypothetical protein
MLSIFDSIAQIYQLLTVGKKEILSLVNLLDFVKFTRACGCD